MFFVLNWQLRTCGRLCKSLHRVLRYHPSRPVFLNSKESIGVVTRRERQNIWHTFNKSIARSLGNMTDAEGNAVQYLDIPDKSENDKKFYKTIRLQNGLRALLVSDPSPIPHDGLTTSESQDDSSGGDHSSSSSDSATTSTTGDTESNDSSEEGNEKLAACAVLIDVGSFSEPSKYQGLAHFLEHMIFMGSNKYPKENEFDAHIKKCGGFSNANTECEETLFYFEVSEQHLDSSLDYFTALMKWPLMKKEAMTRERNAVESEFQQIMHDDETRRDQLLASLATEGYPHATFTWGNLKSLKDNNDDDELHRVLHEFRKEHYSAHRMVVCLQARLPIDELETMVVTHFSSIPSNESEGRDFTKFSYRNAFREEFHRDVFFVKPVENVCKLELTWVWPPILQYYRSKPDQFLSYLLGYEGEGSLCAFLRKRLWGLELLAGIDDSGFDSNSMYSLFNLCIYLTDEGFKHIDDVISATFAFVKLFKDSSELSELYTELQQIDANGFRFQSQKAAYDNVQNLVVKTKYYPPKDILTSTDLYYEFNEEQLDEIIQHLNEFKFNIMITSQQKYPGIQYDKREKWFGTEYASMAMPQKWQDLWLNSKPNDELFLPKPNRFISNDFLLFWQDSGRPYMPSPPKKLLDSDTCELWFRQDDKFSLPEAFMYFYFVSPLLRQSVKNDVLCTLYALLVKFRLVEQLYPATVAGLSYQFYSAEKGVVLKVSGYNEKLHLLVDLITKAMTTMDEHFDSDMFDVFVKYQKKNFFNAVIKAKTLNKDIRLSVVEHVHWPMMDKYKSLNTVKFDDLRDFCRKFTEELYIQVLMQGNYTEESAHNVMNTVLSTLNCNKISEPKYIENRTVQLPQGAHYIRCHGLNNKDANTVVTNYYQIGPCSVRMEGILDLLIMFVEEPLFDHLRTKEQLGYYVNATVRVTYGIAGYSITVNSQETKNTAQHVEDRIEVFRVEMLGILEDMTDEEFLHMRESLIKIKMVVDMSLEEEVARNWGEIATEEYFFDRRRREIEVLRTLTKREIIDFLLDNERTNLRKLSVQVIGHRPPGDANEMDVDDQEHESTPDGDTVADEHDNGADEEELFNALANRIDLVFIPKEGDATTITDINDFKENLHVFPITKTRQEAT